MALPSGLQRPRIGNAHTVRAAEVQGTFTFESSVRTMLSVVTSSASAS